MPFVKSCFFSPQTGFGKNVRQQKEEKPPLSGKIAYVNRFAYPFRFIIFPSAVENPVENVEKYAVSSLFSPVRGVCSKL